MVSHFINEPEHWRARAEEARILANQQKKRGFSRIKWMMRRLKSRCYGSLRTMSALLREPRAGPWGASPIEA